jgi:hypothetical protein
MKKTTAALLAALLTLTFAACTARSAAPAAPAAPAEAPSTAAAATAVPVPEDAAPLTAVPETAAPAAEVPAAEAPSPVTPVPAPAAETPVQEPAAPAASTAGDLYGHWTCVKIVPTAGVRTQDDWDNEYAHLKSLNVLPTLDVGDNSSIFMGGYNFVCEVDAAACEVLVEGGALVYPFTMENGELHLLFSSGGDSYYYLMKRG